ncbi:MAG: glycosyltransferase family 2 protein, partial [Bryobacteraceae bacterium]
LRREPRPFFFTYMQRDSVCVTVVTYNSARFIRSCFESLLRQTYYPLEIVVVDNASQDSTLQELAPFRKRIRLIRNPRNAGFAEGQNQAIAASRSDWVLTLNPDVQLEPNFIEKLVDAARIESHVGTVCGKLLGLDDSLRPFDPPRIDSTGIYFTPSFRHFDRGWNEVDRDRYQRPEFVFGACAAAALYRREMIEDASLEDGFFDPDFFIYREDADVAWRSQLLGWRCLYTPDAVGHHVRGLKPGPRSKVPALVNMHSVKNRFLLRIKNATADVYRRHWLAMTGRDLLVIGGCLLQEPASLPAFWRLAKCFPRAVEKRRHIMARRRVTDQYLASWISDDPVSQPLAPAVSSSLAVASAGVRRDASARVLS